MQQQDYVTDTPYDASAQDSGPQVVYREYPVYRDPLSQTISDAYVDAGLSASFARLGTLWTVKEYEHARKKTILATIFLCILGCIPCIVFTLQFALPWLLFPALFWIFILVVLYQYYWEKAAHTNVQSVREFIASFPSSQ